MSFPPSGQPLCVQVPSPWPRPSVDRSIVGLGEGGEVLGRRRRIRPQPFVCGCMGQQSAVGPGLLGPGSFERRDLAACSVPQWACSRSIPGPWITRPTIRPAVDRVRGPEHPWLSPGVADPRSPRSGGPRSRSRSRGSCVETWGDMVRASASSLGPSFPMVFGPRCSAELHASVPGLAAGVAQAHSSQYAPSRGSRAVRWAVRCVCCACLPRSAGPLPGQLQSACLGGPGSKSGLKMARRPMRGSKDRGCCLGSKKGAKRQVASRAATQCSPPGDPGRSGAPKPRVRGSESLEVRGSGAGPGLWLAVGSQAFTSDTANCRPGLIQVLPDRPIPHVWLSPLVLSLSLPARGLGPSVCWKTKRSSDAPRESKASSTSAAAPCWALRPL